MSWWQRASQKRGWVACLLLPIATLYGALVAYRHRRFASGDKKIVDSAVPVLVVGNITAGGSGKSPLTAALANWLASRGWRPGIVSRGYGGKPQHAPLLVTAASRSAEVGDEPLMHALTTRLPVCVCTERALAVQYLVEQMKVDVVVADDGLQHYAMQRHVEIAVFDEISGVGNGWLLPAGPLRESVYRLATVDAVFVKSDKRSLNSTAAPSWFSSALPNQVNDSLNQSLSLTGPQPNEISAKPFGWARFTLKLGALKPVSATSTVRPLDALQGQTVHAVTGIGNPDRFFCALEAEGLDVIRHPLPDHHRYVSSDVDFADTLPVLVTSKDAVKLRQLPSLSGNVFEVPATVSFSPTAIRLLEFIESRLKSTVAYSVATR